MAPPPPPPPPPPPWKNQRIRGARVAWAPKKEEKILPWGYDKQGT